MKDISQRIREVQHFGEQGGVVPVVDVSATSTFLDPMDMERTFKGELEGCYLYSRHSNPTVKAFGEKLAALEGMEAGLGLSSGMSAIYCSLRQLMPEGGHIISSRTIYGGSYALFLNIFPKMGINVSFVDLGDERSIQEAIRADTKVIYCETMSNPLLRIADLPALSKICKKNKFHLVVDNTFTPVLVSPAKFGADIVIHSCTKYISGASDLIAGAISASAEFIAQLIDVNTGMVMLAGPVMDAEVAHKLYTRLDHLGTRMAAHSKSAAYLATRLAERGIPVTYPGFENHVDHQLFSSLLNSGYGHGGMITVDCKSTEKAMALANKLQAEKFGLYAVSLGFSRTLMSCPSVSTSSEIPEAEQDIMGLSPGLLRLSVGYVGDDEFLTEKFLKCYAQICT